MGTTFFVRTLVIYKQGVLGIPADKFRSLDLLKFIRLEHSVASILEPPLLTSEEMAHKLA